MTAAVANTTEVMESLSSNTQNLAKALSEESEFGEGDDPCCRKIFTPLGVWGFLGLCYWIGITLWSFKYVNNDTKLYYYTVSASIAAGTFIMIVFAGINRGIKAGTSR